MEWYFNTGEVRIIKGNLWIQGGSNAGGDVNRMTLTSGMPTGLQYNSNQRGTRIFSNAIAFADPKNGNSNNDSGWIRHLEDTANSGILEIATSDDGNESIVARQYNTSSAIVRTLTLLDASGNTIIPGTLTVQNNVSFGSSNTSNYISIHGLTGDAADTQQAKHYYIGNRHWGGSESSELVLFSGNDLGNGNNADTASGSGPDRIRYIGAAHLFQTYSSALFGEFETVCTSSSLVNIFEINTNNLTGYKRMILQENNSWLTPARLQLLRPDTTIYTDRACVGVTNGNLHVDAYKDKGLYLNFYSSSGNVYFNGDTYYINGGNYNGNAATATKWAAAQTVYVTLGTASTTTTIQGGSTSAQTIGVNGTLGTGNGGTGNTSFTQWGVVYANPATKLVNTAAGTSGYLLQGNGSAAPSWIQATNANTASTIVKRDGSGNFSAGTITATLSGKASSADKLNTNAGSVNVPVYFSGGVPVATNNKLGAASDGSYWGMRGAGNEDGWIRTTSNGLIPVQSGGRTGGHSSLGTSSWYFSAAYIDTAYHQNVYSYGSVWGGNLLVNSNWLGFYAAAVDSSTRYGYIQCNADRMYFAKENSSSQNEYFYFYSRIYCPSISIGYTNTSYSLSASSAIINSWIRTKGSTGWYNEDYGGGWYMSDTTYVRAYNSKRIYTANSEQYSVYTEGGFCTTRGGAVFSIYYSGAWRDIIHNHGNGNVSIDGASGSLFLSYYAGYTYFGGETYCIDRSGYFNGTSAAANQIYVTGSSGTQYLTGVPEYSTKNQTQYIYSPCYMSGGNLYAYNLYATSGLIVTTANGITAYFGAQNNSFVHFTNNAAPYYFDHSVYVNGTLYWYSNSSYYWNGNAGYSSTYYTNNWFRSYNATGWYNESYGGGIYMSDNSYVRVYNGKYFIADRVYNAVWNDYAECRNVETEEPGRCVTETTSKKMALTTERLQAGCKFISDTFGTCIGETEQAKVPIAIAGRVLAYPYRAREEYKLGDAVCSAPNGTVDIMTRDEIMMYPERIVGTVSEIPDYEIWQAGSKENPSPIQVNGRIWIYVK